ncbi:DUF3846 domain-containing protein [Paenibacillus sp. FSL R7-0302]|uniref:DUF3846 domain-containing protein n=1 Tax=Paenibacillus sp. FSL R7-0302 TaxID=2921681 RepID=UPI0030F8E83E
MSGEMIKAVLKRPQQKAEYIEFEHTLENLQKYVGGYIEIVPSYPMEGYLFIINEEGKFDENCLPNINYGRNDFIAGNILVMLDGGNCELAGLPEFEAKAVMKVLDGESRNESGRRML